MQRFNTAPELRAFLKTNGFPKVKVRYTDSPFGGEGRYLVTLTDIPPKVLLLHVSGSQGPACTYGDDKVSVERIANLRKLLFNSNTIVNH